LSGEKIFASGLKGTGGGSRKDAFRLEGVTGKKGVEAFTTSTIKMNQRPPGDPVRQVACQEAPMPKKKKKETKKKKKEKEKEKKKNQTQE